MMNNKKFLTLALAILLVTAFSGCIHNPRVTILDPKPIPLKQIKTPRKPTLSQRQQNKLSRAYLRQFFRPWHLTAKSADRFMLDKPVSIQQQQIQTLRDHITKTSYAENFHPQHPQWVAKITQQMNMARYPNHGRRGIIIHQTALRALPTQTPAFNDFRQAGEGFPFDNLQYSAIWPGTPIYVLHLSRDGTWALVVGPTMYGWIPASDFAYVSANFVNKWQTGNYIVIRREHVPLKDQAGYTRADGRIGMLLPRDDKHIYLPVANAANYAIIRRTHLPKTAYTKFPWRFSTAHMQSLIQQIAGEPYGWGGLFYFRDCSQLLLDVFTTFGIYLPRNSTLQLQYYAHQDVSAFTPAQKKQTLAQQKPYLTLLGLPGHIMLYLGEYQNKPVVFHDIWGLKTKDVFGHKGRRVIGQAIVTTLPIISHAPHLDKKKAILPRVKYISQIS